MYNSSLCGVNPRKTHGIAMAVCVDCKKHLKILVEPEEEDEDEVMVAASSANTGCWVDDDVQLQCGCHFHWSV